MNEPDNQSPLPHPKPQPHQTAPLDPANARETNSLRRTRIRFTGYRTRPLDPDNFAASIKDLLDGLRHARLIPGDEHWRIIFETAQVKVKSYSEEFTLIEIFFA